MQKQGNKTLDIWKRVISGCDFDDVGTVINKMIDGEMQLPKAYERETTPQLVKRAANDLRHHRAERRRMSRLSAQATAPKDANKFFYAMRFCLTHKQPGDAVKRIIAWTHGGPHPGIDGFRRRNKPRQWPGYGCGLWKAGKGKHACQIAAGTTVAHT